MKLPELCRPFYRILPPQADRCERDRKGKGRKCVKDRYMPPPPQLTKGKHCSHNNYIVEYSLFIVKTTVMLKMSAQIDNIVSAYKTLTKIPSILGGTLNNAGNRVTAKWSVRNIDKGKPTKYLHNYVLNENLAVVTESEFGLDVSNELLSAVSPRETFRAVIREEKDAKDSKKQYLEVWSKQSLKHAIDLTALDIHGDVYADSEFGNLDWSQDESSVVYVAERKVKKSEPYIKRKGEEKKTDGSGEAPPKKGEEYVYRQDWGEQLVGKYISVIVVCRVETETFTVLEGLPEDWCPGQVRFLPDGASVVGTAWSTEPRRLGLIYCTNRPSYIFTLTLDGHLTKLSPEGSSVRSPRVTKSGDVTWLQRVADGPHHACHAIVRRKLNGTEITPIVDIVETMRQIANNKSFFGVYSLGLPRCCFSNDAGRLVFSSPQQNEVRSYVADIDGGRIVDISNTSLPQSTTVLDVKNDVILATCSNVTTPGQLFVARLPPSGQESNIKWVSISSASDVPSAVQNATIQYLDLEHDNSSDSIKSFTALYMAPKSEDKKIPLVVWPHGGPHSSFVNAFSLEAALFAMLGIASIRVNYRGSIGAGDASARCLISNAGQYDVNDCYLVLTHLLERDGHRDNVLLWGGSFGGFTVGHLAGRYPDMFKAVVMRNPLIDLATKANFADNSDGCAVEAGFVFTERGPVSEDELLAMRRCSPLVHVHKVKAPTMLLLGSGDKRVPHYQGLEYARRLKANGVPTRVFMYDDNHALSTQPAEMDHIINGTAWLLEHTQS